MRICVVLAAVVFLAPCAAAAQTTTADGVQALIRGDYPGAVRILLPLADDARRPDPIAQFMMATMYRSGRGVPADLVRACGYYLKAATPPSPVMVQSSALARTIHQDVPLMLAQCAAARDDIRRDPPGASSTLAPDQLVQIDQRSITGEGVDAFVRGDYQRAVEILQPIAEAAGSPDNIAQFFMAMLYESAIGVSGDAVRACVLYDRVAHGQGLFASQAMELNRAVILSMQPEEVRECEFVQSEGFNPAFQPVTFPLEPGQWISLDHRAATISYQGVEKRFSHALARAGVVFLPVEHTELTRRHFIEIFMWVPARDMQTWTLEWVVHEVVRNEWIAITGGVLTTVSAAQPPAIASSDIHAMAHLRVADSGNAEWTVVSGPNSKSGIIEPDAERQERSQQRLAREAADARVDWKRVRDPKRVPALTYSGGDGCGNVFLYGWSGDRTEAIAVRADKDRLQLSTTPRTFDVAAQKADLEIVVHVFEQPRHSWPFCTDLGEPEVQTWRAIGGTVTIELSPPGVRAAQPSLYRATIHIVGAEFVSATGVRVRQTQPMTLSAVVGFSQF